MTTLPKNFIDSLFKRAIVLATKRLHKRPSKFVKIQIKEVSDGKLISFSFKHGLFYLFTIKIVFKIDFDNLCFCEYLQYKLDPTYINGKLIYLVYYKF